MEQNGQRATNCKCHRLLCTSYYSNLVQSYIIGLTTKVERPNQDQILNWKCKSIKQQSAIQSHLKFQSIRIVGGGGGGGGIGGGASAVHAGLKHAASTSSPPVSPPSTLQYRKKFRRMSREGSSSGE